MIDVGSDEHEHDLKVSVRLREHDWGIVPAVLGVQVSAGGKQALGSEAVAQYGGGVERGAADVVALVDEGKNVGAL